MAACPLISASGTGMDIYNKGYSHLSLENTCIRTYKLCNAPGWRPQRTGCWQTS
jgi:hypothetical protein